MPERKLDLKEIKNIKVKVSHQNVKSRLRN